MVNTLLLVSLGMFAAAEGQYPQPEGPAMQALATLDSALKQADSESLKRTEQVTLLRRAIEKAAGMLPPQSPLADRLNSALEKAKSLPAEQQLEPLAQAAAAANEALSFAPKKEADLPKGFPTYTPVGVIQVKQYPIYRAAEAKKFWTLFGHIKLKGIAMTAPVEMQMKKSDDRWRQKSMAFLYGKPDLGKKGVEGPVQVKDVKPKTVVSLGVRGRRSQKVVDDAAEA